MTSNDKIEVPTSLIDAINGLPDAAFLFMDDGVIIAVNAVAAEMFDYSRSQLIGSQIDELMPAGARDYRHEAWTATTSDMPHRQFTCGRTFECERRGGEVFQADIMFSPTEIDGVPMMWAIVRDLDHPTVLNAGRQQVLDALDAIGRMAASTLDLRDDFSVVAERLKEIIPHDHISVTLISEDDPGTVEVAYLAGDIHPDYVQGERIPLVNSATGWVVETKSRVSFTKTKTEFAPPSIQVAFKQGYVEACGVPMFDGEVVIGMLILSTREEPGFSEFQKSLIERLANHMGVGVVNQRMRARLQAQALEIESIGEIGKTISSSPDLDSAFSAASKSISRLVPYDRLSISSIDLEGGAVTGMFSDGEKLPGFDKQTHVLPAELAQTLRELFAAGHALQFDQETIAAAAESQPSFVPYGDAGYRWALVVPLLVTQTPVGMMVFGRKDSTGYYDEEIGIASRIGEQLAGPVANAFQLDRAKDEAKTESILAEIGRVIDSTFDLQTGEHELGPLIRELVDNDSITISSVTQDGMNLRLAYLDHCEMDGQDDWTVGSIHSWKGTDAERTFQAREPIVVHTENWADFKASFPGIAPIRSGVAPKSVITVPMITNDELFGFLTLWSVERNAYSKSDVAMSVRIGAQLTGSVALSELRHRDTELASERAALALVGGLLGSAIELGDVWAEFAEALSGLLPFSHISLASIDANVGVVRTLHCWWAGDEEWSGRKPGDVFQLKDTIAENLVTVGQGVIYAFENPGQWKRQFPGSHPATVDNPVRSLIGVPLIWGGEAVAVLFIHHLKPNVYNAPELRLAERIAAQIAGPVAGSLLRARDAELAVERETLARIGVLMSSGLGVGEVFDEVSELASGLIDFDAIALAELDIRNQTFSAMGFHGGKNWDDNYARTRVGLPVEGTVIGKAIIDRIGFIYSYLDAAQLAKDFPNTPEDNLDTPARTSIAIPLIWGDEIVAVLWLTRVGQTPFTERDLIRAERIATQIAGPVAGGLLRERDEALARERATLAGIGELMGGAPDIDSVFEEFVDRVRQLTTFGALSFLEIDHVRQVVKSEHSFQEKRVEPLQKPGPMEFPLPGSMAERVTVTRQGVLYFSESAEGTRNEFPGAPTSTHSGGRWSSIVVPLIWGDEVAVAFWMTRDEELFTEHDLALAERIAAQIAGPVAGALVRKQETELAEERRRREAAEVKAAALAELNETKSNFISAMSHELRTPLTSIIAFADILSRQEGISIEERQLQQVIVIQRNARRLEGMINELLDLSRMESGRFEIVRSPFDFVSMITESLESSELQFEAMSQTVKFEIVSEVLPINGDRGRLLQVVNNLLDNASKYSPKDTEIEIEVTEEKGWLNFEVGDRGPGIAGDRPEELFEMFHRADDELTRSVPGTGIGLHIAKRIIEEHGGKIIIETRQGGGATVRFWIPTGVNVLK